MMMSKRGYFITIEGVEGSGKTTAMQFLQQQLDIANVNYMVTREPGGTTIAEAIREVLLSDYDELMNPNTELLLMFAARAQNVAHIIEPALNRGKWVLSDRFTDASFAYQGGGRNVPLKRIAALAEWVQGDLQPDLTFVLDVPVELGLSRISKRGVKDRIEREGVEFFERVRQMYLTLAEKNPQRMRVINAEKGLIDVQEQMLAVLSPLLVEA